MRSPAGTDRSRRQALLFPAAAALALALTGPGCATCDLAEETTRLAGAEALDCGTFQRTQNLDAGHRCTVEAFRARRAFRMIAGQRGVDSQVLVALVGGADGTLRVLHWDSDPSGGSHVGAVVREAPCGNPRVEAAADQLDWAGSIPAGTTTPGQEVIVCDASATTLLCG